MKILRDTNADLHLNEAVLASNIRVSDLPFPGLSCGKSVLARLVVERVHLVQCNTLSTKQKQNQENYFYLHCLDLVPHFPEVGELLQPVLPVIMMVMKMMMGM